MRLHWYRLAFVVALAAAATVPLLAHMKVTSSIPAANSTITAPPSMIEVSFTEDPDVAVSKLEMSGPSGAIELTGLHAMGEKTLMASVSQRLAAGVYTVSWQSAGTDGHVQKGQFKFTLKAAE